MRRPEGRSPAERTRLGAEDRRALGRSTEVLQGTAHRSAKISLVCAARQHPSVHTGARRTANRSQARTPPRTRVLHLVLALARLLEHHLEAALHHQVVDLTGWPDGRGEQKQNA